MDRPLDTSHLQKKKQYRYLQWTVGIFLAVGVGYYITQWITPSVERNMLRTAFVSREDIEATINASGVVVPEFEQTITSPIDTRLLKVIRQAGDSLNAGEPIALLDLDYVRISIRKNNDQLLLKSNALAQLQATYKSNLMDLRSQFKNKKLDVAYKKNAFEQNKILLEKKAIARNDFLEKELAYQQALNEMEQLAFSLENLEESIKLQEQGLKLEINILRSELELLEQQLKQATTASERPGILTWVLNTEGASIRKGEALAKIADLSAYKLEVKVSDIHAANIYLGMPVKAKISQTGQELLLTGEVTNIRPTVENGVMEVQVRLHEANHKALRPNLRLEVYLIKESKEQALVVRTPSFASDKGRSEVFVIQGDKAVKRLIKVGVRSADKIEVIEGLNPADEVILSDMDEYKHLEEIGLN